jgi:hypothetical protein
MPDKATVLCRLWTRAHGDSLGQTAQDDDWSRTCHSHVSQGRQPSFRVEPLHWIPTRQRSAPDRALSHRIRFLTRPDLLKQLLNWQGRELMRRE